MPEEPENNKGTTFVKNYLDNFVLKDIIFVPSAKNLGLIVTVLKTNSNQCNIHPLI